MSQRKRRWNDMVSCPIQWQSEASAPVRKGEPLWDFSVLATPAASAVPATPAAPSPATEFRRAKLVSGLRQRYAEACREILFLERPPADSLDRWMLEQLSQPPSAGDPLLPKPGIAETSRVLLRELVAEVPLRCPTRAFGPPAFEALQRYHTSAERWLSQLGSPVELKASVDALGSWIEERKGGAAKRRNPMDCPFKGKLQELADLSARFRAAVEPLALRIVSIVSDEARAVVHQMEDKAQEDHQGSDSNSEDVSVKDSSQESAALVCYKEDSIQLSRMHLQKLHRLYALQHPGCQDVSDKAWLRSLYVMLRRYVTFIGLDPAVKGLQGGNMHAAAPESVFHWLQQEMEVRFEVFASPMNCYFPHFFSAFPDVDSDFGSKGSFFHAASLPEGSYEVGPPYTEEVLELTARKLLQLLQDADSSNKALSFVLFVPDWEGCGGLNLLGSAAFAPFRRVSSAEHGYLLAQGREHAYISGVQFFADVGDDAARRYYVVPHSTRVYLLQSAAGAARWLVTKAKEHELLESLRPKT